MADIKLDYNTVPEVFSNGTRVKGIFVNGTQVWPIDSETGELEYTVTFDPQEGSVETSFNSGWERTVKGHVLNPPQATHSDWTFLGWADYLEADSPNIIFSDYSFGEDATVYAVWDKEVYIGGQAEIFNIAEYLAVKDLYDEYFLYNEKTLVASARQKNWYVFRDETGYLLMEDFDEEDSYSLADKNTGSVFSDFLGGLSDYRGTRSLEFYEFVEESTVESTGEEPWVYTDRLTDNDSTYFDLNDVWYGVLEGGGKQCCQPLALFVPTNDADFCTLIRSSAQSRVRVKYTQSNDLIDIYFDERIFANIDSDRFTFPFLRFNGYLIYGIDPKTSRPYWTMIAIDVLCGDSIDDLL